MKHVGLYTKDTYIDIYIFTEKQPDINKIEKKKV